MTRCPECGMVGRLCICDEADEFDIEDTEDFDTEDFDADELGIDPEEE